EDLSLEEKLEQEYEVTGFYLSGHPTEQYTEEKNDLGTIFLLESESNQYKKYIVSVNAVKRIQTKRGEPMAFVEVADTSGEATCILFPTDYRKYGKLVKKNAVVLLEGKAEWKKGQWNILTSKISNIDDSNLKR